MAHLLPVEAIAARCHVLAVNQKLIAIQRLGINGKAVNNRQKAALNRLQNELSMKHGIVQELPIRGEDDGFVFTEVDGVTVVIGPGGGFQLPAVRTYPGTGKPGEKAIDAALDPNYFFRKQSKDAIFKTGHLGPTIGVNWTCGIESCPCNHESIDVRKKRSLIGHR
ncbi:MAG: hypothetical protein LAO23_00930 [Acidobacteriia bacterium]|nr:hypothetical protein [Terriglobia bacterium]